MATLCIIINNVIICVKSKFTTQQCINVSGQYFYGNGFPDNYIFVIRTDTY